MTPEWIQAIFTAIAAVSVLYGAANQRKNAPNLKFEFQGASWHYDGEKLTLSREGLIRNLCNAQDTISRVAIVFWEKRYRRYKFFSVARAITVVDQNGSPFTPPFNIPARMTSRVTVKVRDLHVGLGTNDDVSAGDFQVCFETTDGSWFNESGKLIDIKSAHTIWVMRSNGLVGWVAKSWLNKRFWDLDWKLTKSMNDHTRRKIFSFFGL
jgi:hypothetical protein